MELISIKDRMPEKDGRYLVNVLYITPPNWIGVSSLRNGIFDDTTTSHWMPLPEPPNE